MRSLVLILLLGVASARAQVPDGSLPSVPAVQPALLPDAPTDYSRADHWLCRPDKADNPCRIALDAVVLGDDGTDLEHTPLPASAPVDCFYVYPTVSGQSGYFSDLAIEEVHRDIAAGQAARFSTLCNVYAPVYRQLTLAGLSWSSRNGFLRDDRNWRDVRAAFAHYLAHDNKGRGVVFVGHSQGARMITALIKEFVEGKPLQKQLVLAVLAGNGDDMFGAGGSMTVAPRGRTRGGTFESLPMCRLPGEAGCIIAWSSYAANYEGPRAFGNHDKAGHVGACVSPADIGSGAGNAIAYFHSSHRAALAVQEAPTPFIKVDQQMSVVCAIDSHGHVLRLSVREGPHAEKLRRFLAPYGESPVNLHMLDLALVQGNVIDAVARASARWRAK
ncbi:MAG: DUF3089 domain-containing protein [Rhodospirillaceae bacterium]